LSHGGTLSKIKNLRQCSSFEINFICMDRSLIFTLIKWTLCLGLLCRGSNRT